MNSVTLTVHGRGHVPSFKNNKRSILDSRTGLQRTLTPKKDKDWMKACVDDFVFQLLSGLATKEGGTWTARSLQSAIASLPHDDCWQVIPEIQIQVLQVPKGQEGANITIEQIP